MSPYHEPVHAELFQRVQAAMDAADISLMDLVKLYKGSKNGWFQRLRSKHLPTHIDQIAAACGIDPAVLRGYKPQNPERLGGFSDIKSGTYHVPVIGSAAASNGAQVEGHESTGEHLAIRPQWQAIRIHGDSGEPVVLRGQTVMVDPTVKVSEGRLVVAFTDDGPVLKRFVGIEAGKMFLASLNAGRGSLIVDAENTRMPLVVVGVVFTDSVAR